jgi:hypothetical protein
MRHCPVWSDCTVCRPGRIAVEQKLRLVRVPTPSHGPVVAVSRVPQGKTADFSFLELD